MVKTPGGDKGLRPASNGGMWRLVNANIYILKIILLIILLILTMLITLIHNIMQNNSNNNNIMV